MTENLFDRPQHPVLVVIAGPSGVGKDTIARGLLERKKDQYYFVVTATTRGPREGEVHGVDYFFMSNDEFARMIDEDELLEWAVVYNDFKGVPKKQIREALNSGRDVIMRVDVQGAATIRKLIPDATFVFLSVESEASMIRRLQERKSETDDQLSLRIATARKEMERVEEFDFYLINYEGQPDLTVDALYSIIEAERRRVDRTAIQL